MIDIMTGGIIGSSRYHDYDPLEKSVVIGFTFLAPAYWGGKYNRELKRLMLAQAYKWVDVVRFGVGERNFRSLRAMEKIGAVPIGSEVSERGKSIILELTKEMAAPLLSGDQS